MVDLDSDPTKLLEVVETGKALLMTRGSLTTFSIANDIAKYFAIIPAMFVATYPQLGALNVMRLASPRRISSADVRFSISLPSAYSGSSITLTWAAAMRHPSLVRTQVCIWRPTFPTALSR